MNSSLLIGKLEADDIVKVAGTYKISIINYGTTNQQLAIEGVDVDVVEPETPEEKEKVTVYYKNSEKFAKVYAYSWNTNGELLGVWPGREMTAETDEWYKIEIEAESLAGINIIFNNNSGSQTTDIVLDSVNPYYYGMNTKGYASFESVEEAIEDANNQSSSANLFLNCGGSGLWDQAGAWFAAYCWNDSGSEWFEMKDSNGDGIYETNIGEGYKNVIFCRMASNKTKLDFSSAWNKTGDLSLPTDGSNPYTISGWGANDGSWSTK